MRVMIFVSKRFSKNSGWSEPRIVSSVAYHQRGDDPATEKARRTKNQPCKVQVFIYSFDRRDASVAGVRNRTLPVL